MVEVDELVEITNDNYGAAVARLGSHFFKASVKNMTFTITDFSCIPFTQWYLNVPQQLVWKIKHVILNFWDSRLL